MGLKSEIEEKLESERQLARQRKSDIAVVKKVAEIEDIDLDRALKELGLEEEPGGMGGPKGY